MTADTVTPSGLISKPKWTKETGELPTPERFRKQTRQFLTQRGIEIPEDSVLATP